MRKSLVYLVIILCLLGGPLGAVKPPFKLMRLTIINKSDMAVGVKLTGKTLEQFYYLRLEKGSRVTPTIGQFTVAQDTYTAQVYYIEYWDPVYGYRCGSTPTSRLDVMHPSRLTLLPCGEGGRYSGEPGMVKLPAARTGRGRLQQIR